MTSDLAIPIQFKTNSMIQEGLSSFHSVGIAGTGGIRFDSICKALKPVQSANPIMMHFRCHDPCFYNYLPIFHSLNPKVGNLIYVKEDGQVAVQEIAQAMYGFTDDEMDTFVKQYSETSTAMAKRALLKGTIPIPVFVTIESKSGAIKSSEQTESRIMRNRYVKYLPFDMRISVMQCLCLPFSIVGFSHYNDKKDGQYVFSKFTLQINGITSETLAHLEGRIVDIDKDNIAINASASEIDRNVLNLAPYTTNGIVSANKLRAHAWDMDTLFEESDDFTRLPSGDWTTERTDMMYEVPKSHTMVSMYIEFKESVKTNAVLYYMFSKYRDILNFESMDTNRYMSISLEHNMNYHVIYYYVLRNVYAFFEKEPKHIPQVKQLANLIMMDGYFQGINSTYNSILLKTAPLSSVLVSTSSVTDTISSAAMVECEQSLDCAHLRIALGV